MSSRVRLLIAGLATSVVLAPLIWLWATSLLPDQYSVMDMGYADYGGGAVPTRTGHDGQHSGGVNLTGLVDDPERPADVKVHLVAEQGEFRLASDRIVDGYSLNGQSPGPQINAVQGQMVEVRLDNKSVTDGITLHWHGVDVPNAMDGVAGVTQEAVPVGGSYTYRFVAHQVGTYWYHSHQLSHEQVRRGLLGALVVSPEDQDPDVVDETALVHIYEGRRTVNGREGDVPVEASPGSTVRVRVINTDNGVMSIWVGGASYRLLAVDGTDVNAPTEVSDTSLRITAGARMDLEVVMPQDGAPVRVELGGTAAVVLESGAFEVPETPKPEDVLDLLGYGSPRPIGFDPADATRDFEYVVGRRPGFLDGRPGMWWTINGHLFPNVPMFTITEGDIVRMRIENRSGEVHPMHLHGHHVLVLARDGVQASGSPWWTDSLNVADGESYDVAFIADNPGIWMDHCHNLPHAAQGLVAHLMYTGVHTPYTIGGSARNEPE